MLSSSNHSAPLSYAVSGQGNDNELLIEYSGSLTCSLVVQKGNGYNKLQMKQLYFIHNVTMHMEISIN